MKDETGIWLKYAYENLQAAKVLLNSKLFNPCLQNIQQAVEKALKALIVEFSMRFKRTHSMMELKTYLIEQGIEVVLSDKVLYPEGIFENSPPIYRRDL
jgi:HEPN domain-containing protein